MKMETQMQTRETSNWRQHGGRNGETDAALIRELDDHELDHVSGCGGKRGISPGVALADIIAFGGKPGLAGVGDC
jgi:hypothetical protein